MIQLYAFSRQKIEVPKQVRDKVQAGSEDEVRTEADSPISKKTGLLQKDKLDLQNLIIKF
jgi:hypothetical protein